jgi:hypothetical protein
VANLGQVFSKGHSFTGVFEFRHGT